MTPLPLELVRIPLTRWRSQDPGAGNDTVTGGDEPTRCDISEGDDQITAAG